MGVAERRALDRYAEMYGRAELYYAYDFVHRFVEDPFSRSDPNTLFNIARCVGLSFLGGFAALEHGEARGSRSLTMELGCFCPRDRYMLMRMLQRVEMQRKDSPLGISMVKIIKTLAKFSEQLGAFKLVRPAGDFFPRGASHPRTNSWPPPHLRLGLPTSGSSPSSCLRTGRRRSRFRPFASEARRRTTARSCSPSATGEVTVGHCRTSSSSCGLSGLVGRL